MFTLMTFSVDAAHSDEQEGDSRKKKNISLDLYVGWLILSDNLY